MDKIYDAYNLKNKELPNYPSFEERSASAKEVGIIVEDLIGLFEANKYLMVLGEYKLAASCLEYINKYYQGYEIRNNLGVTYLLSALEFFDVEKNLFAFPLALNSSTQLEKIDLSRGDEKLSPTDRRFRDIIIDESIKPDIHGLRELIF